MKKFHVMNKFEKGQIIPLVVVMLFVVIGMVALIIDGGAVMSNRRTAQAAADAGALAGAQRACLGFNDAQAVAEYYATVNNNATTALATVVGKQVTVNTTVEHPSIFARIFGDLTLEANAEATAGCFGPRGKSVVPLSWRCRPNDGTGPFNAEYGCEMQTLSWELIGPLVDPNWDPPSERVASLEISDYDGNPVTYHISGTSIVDEAGVPPEQIYIIFDGNGICGVDGNDPNLCDLDGDGKIDVQTDGNRGYIYLDNNPTHNLKDYLQIPNISMKTHTWLSGKSGLDRAVIDDMADLGFPGKVVLMPIYNYLCNNYPETDPVCMIGAHASPWLPLPDDGDVVSERNQDPYFHIIAFAPFYVSCVSAHGDCPGYRYAQTFNSELKDNKPSFEGYFLTDVDVSTDSTQDCSINLGNCTVSLSK